MVTQEAGPSNLQGERKSFAAAAIRRGDVKISEPITWVEGVPDASLTQHMVSSTVQPEGTATSESQPDVNPAHGVTVSTQEGHRDSDSIGEEPPLQVKRSSVAARDSRRLATPVDRLTDYRSSTIETSPGSSSQMQAKKKRKSGTIRTVFRKVFGRRDKSISKHISPPPSRSGPKHEYARSDPIPARNKSTESVKEKQRSKVNLSNSESDEEYLSHPPKPPPMLPFPMNVNAPEHSPPEPSQNYISFETSPRVHRRRATLPSMVLTPADAAVLQKMWSGPDAHHRPAVSPTLSLEHSSHSIPEPMIGMAVTSGGNPNRRSRSAGALHELARMQEGASGLRRRSSEIRYWRTSRVDSQDVERPGSRRNSEDTSGGSSATSGHQSIAELSDAFADTGSSFHGGSHSFDFGSITTETNTAERQVHIVEQRLSQLEFSMQHISMSLQHFNTHSPQRESVMLDKAPRGHRRQASHNLDRPGLPATPKDIFPQRPSRQAIQSSHPAPIRSASSSQKPRTYLASPSPTESLPPFSPLDRQHQNHSRPKTSTGPAPQPSIPMSLPPQNIYDHLAPLYNALRYERNVRKNLEAQIIQLRRDVLDLNNTVTQMRGAASYATPSPDQVMMSHGASMEKSRFSGYDSDADDNEKGDAVRKWGKEEEEGLMF